MDKKIVGYKILTDMNGNKLIELVNIELKIGWQPYGRPFMDDKHVCQAMVKYDK